MYSRLNACKENQAYVLSKKYCFDGMRFITIVPDGHRYEQ